MYSGKLSHSQTMPSVMAAPGMSSTPSIKPISQSCLFGIRRREAHAAIAHHQGGDAVPARRGDVRIPGDLGVVVRMHVDPAGQHQLSAGVDFAVPGANASDLRDGVAVHGHVALECGTPAAVHDRSTLHHQVVHVSSPQRINSATAAIISTTNTTMRKRRSSTLLCSTSPSQMPSGTAGSTQAKLTSTSRSSRPARA